MQSTKTIEVKSGDKWIFSAINRNEQVVFEDLANDLINKKINRCTYIQSIRRRQNYNGTVTVTVTYNNGVRALYVIKG